MLRQRRKPAAGQAPHHEGTGQAVSEYLVFIVLIIGGFILMQPYILRGFAGRWKSVGDSLGYGKLYDPHLTNECVFDYQYYNIWYSVKEFEEQGCDRICYSSLSSEWQRSKECDLCICGSQADECDVSVPCHVF